MLRRDALYIDGHWRAPHGNGVIEVYEASTGEPFATVPAGDAADLAAAVTAARAALQRLVRHPGRGAGPAGTGTRRRTGGAQGRARHAHEPRGRHAARRLPPGPGGPGRGRARVDGRRGGGAPGRGVDRLVDGHQPGGRRRRRHHAVELPGLPARRQGRPRARRRLHRRGQAQQRGAAERRSSSRRSPTRSVSRPECSTSSPGPGAELGEALVRHPEVDLVSLTGSTGAGARVAALAAADIKRTTLELGGKSAFLLCPRLGPGRAALDAAVAVAPSSTTARPARRRAGCWCPAASWPRSRSGSPPWSAA